MIGPTRRCVVLAAVVACVAASEAPRGFAVAVLRRDGMLIPFATFDGKRWRNSWPPPQLELTVPVNLDSIPSRWWGSPGPRPTWQAFVGAETSPLRVVQPDWIDVQCMRSITLRTDYRRAAAAPPAIVQPYPKDGIAVSPPQAIEPIEILPVDGMEAQDLAPALLDAFNRSERITEGRYGHPVPARKREGVAPTLEAAYAFGDAPRAYYVEAVRPYRLLGQSAGECAAVGVGTGWFVRDRESIRPLVMTVDLLDCERRSASYMLPFGAMRIDMRLFWLAQFSGWDHERYVVVEITPKRAEAVVSTWGGGC
jgi:hypothetical protein